MTSLLTFLITPALADQYLWTDRFRRGCGLFTDGLKLITYSEPTPCEGIRNYYFVDHKGVASAKLLPGLEPCEPEPPSEQILPESLKEAMTTIGQGVPFLRGHEFIESFEDEGVRGDFSEECRQALEEARQRGPLFLQTLYDASIPIKDFNFRNKYGSDDPNTKFFHHTPNLGFLKLFHPDRKDRAQVHEEMVQKGEYRTIFDRNRAWEFKGHNNAPLTNRVLFLAEDPLSSYNLHRKHRVVFWLEPEARVLQANFYPFIVNGELNRKYPKVFEHCPAKELYVIFAEGSGIALYDYLNDQEWLTLLSFGFVTKTETVVKP